MISLVVGESSFPVSTPRGCTAVMRVFEADYVIYVDEVTGLVSIEAYRGIWLIAAVVEISAIVAARIGNSGIGQQGYG